MVEKPAGSNPSRFFISTASLDKSSFKYYTVFWTVSSQTDNLLYQTFDEAIREITCRIGCSTGVFLRRFSVFDKKLKPFVKTVKGLDKTVKQIIKKVKRVDKTVKQFIKTVKRLDKTVK